MSRRIEEIEGESVIVGEHLVLPILTDRERHCLYECNGTNDILPYPKGWSILTESKR